MEECQACPAGTWSEVLVPGLQWVDVGPVQPSTGAEIYNWQLTDALRNRVTFTPADLDGYNAQPAVILFSSFIKVDDRYFTPVRLGSTTCQDCPVGTKRESTDLGCVDCETVCIIPNALCTRASC